MYRAAAGVNLSLSWQEYRLIARKDVSNYLAVTPQGKVKAKGSYGYDQNDLGRKATDRIVVDAVREYFINNVPLVDTVRGRADIKAFINYFRAPKGSVIVDVNGHDLGSIARWYIGTNGVRLNKQKLVDGKLTQLVEAGAVVLPDLPAAFPEDVDAEHYVGVAEALVQAITEPGSANPQQFPSLNSARRREASWRQQGSAGGSWTVHPARSGALSRRLGCRFGRKLARHDEGAALPPMDGRTGEVDRG